MPFVRNFWLWQPGGSTPPSTGYARFAQGRSPHAGATTGGVLYSREYDLTSFTFTLSTNFSKTPGNGNAESNGAIALFDLAQPSVPIANDLWNFTTRSTILTSNFQGASVTGWTQACSNAGFAIIVFWQCSNGATLSNKQAKYNFTTLTFTTLNPNQGNSPVLGTPASAQSQAIGNSTKGFFYAGSMVYSTNAWTTGDGPPIIPEPTQSVAWGSAGLSSIWYMGGTVSDGDNILTQRVATDTATIFTSQHYKISTDVTVAGPSFVFTFSPLIATSNSSGTQVHGGGASSFNGGISGATLGSFLEKGNTLIRTGIASAQLEDYSYSTGTVTQRAGLVEEPNNTGTTIPNVSGYFYGAPSVPGNF